MEDMVLAVNIPPHEPGSGAGVGLDAIEFVFVHLAGLDLSDGFEDGLDLDVFAFPVSGEDGAAVDEYGWDVESGHGHHCAGEGLVATGGGD